MNSSVGKPNIKKDAFQKDSLRTDFNKQLQQQLNRMYSIINNNSIPSTIPPSTFMGTCNITTNPGTPT